MERTDADLLAAAARGDGDAYGAFFRRHVRPVTMYGVRRCDGPEDVADLVSETFLIALQASGRYRPEMDSALPWLFGISRRVLAHQRRRRVTRQRLANRAAGFEPLVTPDESDAIAAAIDASRQAPALEVALARLPESEREVFLLVAFDGLSPGEAALALDVTPNAARLRLSRARRKLRAQLDAHTLLEARHAV
jgi:RNA polymerase sigma-70 factor (ECF subfamily)